MRGAAIIAASEPSRAPSVAPVGGDFEFADFVDGESAFAVVAVFMVWPDWMQLAWGPIESDAFIFDSLESTGRDSLSCVKSGAGSSDDSSDGHLRTALVPPFWRHLLLVHMIQFAAAFQSLISISDSCSVGCTRGDAGHVLGSGTGRSLRVRRPVEAKFETTVLCRTRKRN